MRRRVIAICILLLAASGCGYTTKALLPGHVKTIYVENFANKIQIEEQTDDSRMYRGYRPQLEFDITKAIVDKFIFDGNLKITDKNSADLILSGSLVDFRRESLRYDANYNAEEYRVRLVVDLELKDVKENKIMWREKDFSGEAAYRTAGSLAKSDSSAIDDARVDLARRVVERTIEGW